MPGAKSQISPGFALQLDISKILAMSHYHTGHNTRLKEHQKTSTPIGEHMGSHNHRFAPETVTVKCKEKDWFRRGIAEAIWIAKENPSLNRDRGKHTLPPVYNQLLSSRDAHTTQGARDDTETADNWRRPEVSGRKLLTFTWTLVITWFSININQLKFQDLNSKLLWGLSQGKFRKSLFEKESQL